MVLALNTISGQIADVSPKMLKHPKFKDVLEIVEQDAKPYVPELFMSGTKQERATRKSKKEELAFEEELVVEDEIIPETEEEI